MGILRLAEGSGKGASEQGDRGTAWESRVGAEPWLEGWRLRANHTFPRPAGLTDKGNESDKPTALRTEQTGKEGGRRWTRSAPAAPPGAVPFYSSRFCARAAPARGLCPGGSLTPPGGGVPGLVARSWNRPLRPSSPSAVPRGARTVLPDAEKLTWDFLRGLPRPVGAAPAMGDEGRRTAVQEKGASSSSACHTPSSPGRASLPRPVSSLLTAHPGQARWTPSPQSHVGSTRRGTDLTGALWGFPFTLAAMFGKHPEPRGGKVLKEREKRSQSLRPRPQAPAKISVPRPSAPGRWAPLGNAGGTRRPSPCGKARTPASRRLVRGKDESCPHPGLWAFGDTPGKQLERRPSWAGAWERGGESSRSDSLWMRCSRRQAEGALSAGSGRSKAGALSGRRRALTRLPQAPPPSAQAPPRRATAFGETVQRNEDALRHSH